MQSNHVESEGKSPAKNGGATRTDGAPRLSKEESREDFLSWKFGLFMHFNVATFNEQEWSGGYEDPATFGPDRLDCDQWAQAAVAGGMKYGILTVKHTGGWCLWKSRYTDHDAKAFVNYKHGGGDIVREFTEAFRKHGLKVGLYYCFPGNFAGKFGNVLPEGRPDLHGMPPEAQGDYLGFIKKQLAELIAEYGPIDLFWIDQHSNVYTGKDWRDIKAYMESLQPGCIVIANNSKDFQDTDIHGYEYPWCMKIHVDALPPEGNQFPSEVCDTIAQSWFWHASDNETNIKTAESIAAMVKLCNSRRANYLLNVAPDRSGLIPAYAFERLKKAGELVGNDAV